ncbi:hypothetical protein [Glaciibacter superstes]|uniref:hypothetical protein n=1 Tax=Glaciibacter superstes TaxID=501023 RepID=UPI0003B76645|nr:hypothetical protein [Glaciibacter superstes]
MKGTRLVTFRINRSDLAQALTLVEGGLEARDTSKDWSDSLPEHLAVVQYSAWYGPETDVISYAEQLTSQATQNLRTAGLWFESVGSGVVAGGGAGYSKYIVRSPGSTDPRESMSFMAMDEADFHRQYDLFFSHIPLGEMEVEVIHPKYDD